MSKKFLRSVADPAQQKNHRDPRGDKNGVIQPYGPKIPNERKNLVSMRWVQQSLRQTAREIGDPFDPEEPEDGEKALERLTDDARYLEREVAMARAFPILWRARQGRVRAGDIIDCGDLFIAGRYGTIEQIVEGILTRRFDGLPRDSDGFIRGCWPGGEDE